MEVQTDSRARAAQPQGRARAARLVGGPVADRADRPDGSIADWPALRGGPGALRPARRAGTSRRARRPRAGAPPRRRPGRVRGDRRPAGQGRQRPLRPRLRRSASSATSASRPAATDAQNTFAIAVAGRGFDARISTEYDGAPARVGVRLLRQLHRRLPDRRADVQVRARDARGRHLGRVGPDRDRHDLPVLRRRLHADASTSRTTGSSRSPRRSTRRSPTATSASRAASASSSSTTARVPAPPTPDTGPRLSRRPADQPSPLRSRRSIRLSCV